MEGVLSVPPERNLISRGNWKHRYVVLGTRKTGQTTIARKLSSPETITENEIEGVEDVFSNRPAEEDFPKFLDVKLAIYRQRTDHDAIASYPIEFVTSCYVGDIAHRKAFSSMSKTTYNPLCPTLIVNIQLPSPTSNGHRRYHSDSPNASSSNLYDLDDGKITLLFRAGPKDLPPLTAWAREIQFYVRSNQSRRGSTISAYGDRDMSRASFRSVAYDLKIQEDEWEEDVPGDRISSGPTNRSSEESTSDGQLNNLTTSDPTPSRPISALHNFRLGGSSDSGPSDLSPPPLSVNSTGCPSLSSSPRRETILDRAFNMNFISSTPSSPSSPHSSTPPLTSVAKFEALASDPALSTNYREFPLDASVMPASFFENLN